LTEFSIQDGPSGPFFALRPPNLAIAALGKGFMFALIAREGGALWLRLKPGPNLA
jgi:hypothetical protein